MRGQGCGSSSPYPSTQHAAEKLSAIKAPTVDKGRLLMQTPLGVDQVEVNTSTVVAVDR
jgi:hypothetical protein